MSNTRSLSEQIEEYKAGFRSKVPETIQATMAKATQSLAASDIAQKAPNTGDKLPTFKLTDQHGKNQTLEQLLSDGPLVITFYRGGWCPYCNLELRAYQDVLGEIKDTGANLIAITPELPDNSLSTVEKNELGFTVLSDVDSKYARSIDLVFTLPEELRPIYESFGIHIEAHNGSGQFDLPLAATYVVAQDGTIINAFVDADYTKRQEPNVAVEALKAHTVAA
ncbi:MAG: peroxiredoxin-like family protein [Cellvibrionaceae bacterium]